MAKYRRSMRVQAHKYLLSQFEGHIDTPGGIFTPKTRRRLLGVRGEKNLEGKPDTADFWQDVRDYTKSALRDLELLAWVAENDQLQDIFAIRNNFTDWNAKTQSWKRPDPLAYLNMLLRHENKEEWRNNLALALVAMSIDWRASYTKKLQNKLILEAFENAKAAVELLMPNSEFRKGKKG